MRINLNNNNNNNYNKKKTCMKMLVSYLMQDTMLSNYAWNQRESAVRRKTQGINSLTNISKITNSSHTS